MNKSEIITGILGSLGFILALGTMGTAEFTGVMGPSFWIKMMISLLLMIVPIMVAIAVERSVNNRSRKNVRKQSQEISRRK